MAVGLTIFNNAQHVQIDDRVKTISLLATRDKSPIDVTKEMVALDAPLYYHKRSIDDAKNLPMYIFSLRPPNSHLNYGLEVFDENGMLSFHSNCLPLRVLHYMEIDTYTHDIITHHVPNVKKLGYVISSYRQGEQMLKHGMYFRRHKGHVKIEIINNDTIQVTPIWEYIPAHIGFARCELCLRLLIVDLSDCLPTVMI